MSKIIELKNIVFSYGNFKAIDNVNLEVGQGVHGLLGPNGAGKTTLMKVILGFLDPSSGNGTVLGHDIRLSHVDVRRKVGYMPESDCLIPGMDAVSLTAYLGELSGMPRQEAIKRAHEVLYYVGLEESRYRMADTYSSGMMQRLKLATALVHDPELLFLDEPTSGMDPQARQEILDLITDISKKGKMNVIISSHILADIESTCRNVVIMNKGKIVANETISHIDKNAIDKFGIDIESGAGTKSEQSARLLDLKLKGDIETFKQNLVSLGINDLKKLENGDYTMTLPRSTSSKAFFKLALESNVQVRHFLESRQTLEDTFVNVIGESNGH
ncbi:MAG: ABC transporter ATP-binding protein [bacterium]|nr:ABC transporter ATP-binding protein [bacterium]